jgi:tetratricopeptide (TPR) repeat protein
VREAGSEPEIATALQSLSEYQLAKGDYQAAQGFAEQALELCRASGDRRGMTWALLDIEQAHMARGNLAAARAATAEAYPSACALHDPWLMENAEHCMGDVTLAAGEYLAAMGHYAAAVRVGRALGDMGQIMFDLEGLGMATAAAGQSERALCLAGASDALRQSLAAAGTWDWWEAAKRRWLGQARRELGEEASAAAVAAGRGMSFERACAFALEQEATES